MKYGMIDIVYKKEEYEYVTITMNCIQYVQFIAMTTYLYVLFL